MYRLFACPSSVPSSRANCAATFRRQFLTVMGRTGCCNDFNFSCGRTGGSLIDRSRGIPIRMPVSERLRSTRPSTSSIRTPSGRRHLLREAFRSFGLPAMRKKGLTPGEPSMNLASEAMISPVSLRSRRTLLSTGHLYRRSL